MALRRRPALLHAVLVGALVAGGAGCDCGRSLSTAERPRVTLTTLRVLERSASQPSPVVATPLEALGRARVPEAWLAPSEPEGAAWRVGIGIGLTTVAGDPPTLLAEGELEVVSPDGRTVPAQPVSASRSVTPPSSVDEARAALVGETIIAFEERVMQLTAPVDEVLARLAGQDAEGRLLAVDRLSLERADIAVPALRQAIRTEASPAARVRMVGALGALGDPRAADDLIALADTRDAELFVAVIDALVQLGGPKAREFFALMSTHDSTEIRALVEDAAVRLERRASMRQRPHQGEP